jgi:hypothetical protein
MSRIFIIEVVNMSKIVFLLKAVLLPSKKGQLGKDASELGCIPDTSYRCD